MGDFLYAAILNKKLVLAIDEALLVKNNQKKLNGEKYYCPKCKKRAILVISQTKTAFFRHMSFYNEAMGEKEEHHSSKMQLKTALTAAGFNAQIEVSLAHGQLRADVLASPKLAFEVQCAPLSTNEFNHRHNLYKKEKIIDIWLVGKRHFLQQKIKKTQKIFFRQNLLWHNYYLEIDPQKEILRLKYHVLLAPISDKLYYRQMEFSLDEKGLIKFWHFKPVYKKYSVSPLEQKKYLELQIIEKTKKGLEIAQALYENNLTLTDLPANLFTELRSINSQDNITAYLKSGVNE